MRCKSRRCRSCGLLWAGDARKKLLANVSHYGGAVALVSITAPGKDRLPTPEAIRQWNVDAPSAWRRLHSAAAQAARRQVGSRPRLLSRSWEYQRRDALHVHVVLGAETAAELAAAHAYVAHLDRLRHEHDFGYVDRGRRRGPGRRLEVIPAERAARYVAKYLSPLDAAGKPTLSQTVLHPDVPPQVLYVDRRLTSATRCTMRTLRERRSAYAQGVDPDTGELLGQVIDEHVLRFILQAGGHADALAMLSASPPDL